MTQPKVRSNSLQRGSRAGSVKRGQRGSAPRRLSDVQERPAWDATSSNLDRFKLTAEEQERRKASRVSKNRPLASGSDAKRTFVEAWAKHVTDNALREDTEADQDQPRSSSVTRDLPGINYGSVVEMLRKSPARPAVAAAATRALPGAEALADATCHANPLVTVSSATDSGPPDARQTASHKSSRAPSAEASTVADSVNVEPSFAAGQGHGNGDGVAVGPGAGASQAQDRLSAQGNRRQNGSAAGEESSAASLATAVAGPLHRADVKITQASLRPRFNQAEATTIIAFGGDSEDGEDDRPCSSNCSPGKGPAAGTMTAGSGEMDPVAAAFEAALFGRGRGASSAVDLGGAAPLAADVEGRLRAVEAALGLTGRGSLPGSGGRSGGGGPMQEELLDLRRELRQVQTDNAKLRQELSSFSTHASALMTQLQAQVQQLLRSGSSGGGGSEAAAFTSAGATAPPVASATRVQTAPSRPGLAAAASIPTTVAAALTAAAASSHMPFDDRNRLAPQPYQPVPQAQPIARRNIFEDLDISSLRPLSTEAAIRNGGAKANVSVAATPLPAAGAAGHVLSAPSPLIDVASVPRAPYTVPIRDLDDSELTLPSFAAFRRSAGAATFTAARPSGPATGGSTLSSPYPTSRAAAAVVPDPPRISPSGAPSNVAAVQPRPFPTQYQPRGLGGVIARPGASANPMMQPPATSVGVAAAAAAATSSANVASGAYMSSLAASATAAVATGSDVAVAALARTHSGLPQPLVFSVGPEFRSARATGLSAENSMSLSAHTAAAAAARAKSSLTAPGGAR